MAKKDTTAKARTNSAVFEEMATKILQELWSELEHIPIEKLPYSEHSKTISEIFSHNEIGWKYSIIIQVTGKAADFSLDTLCLQKKEGSPSQWDPRDFGKRVVVPWNKFIGAPLGDSGDPYVNNIFRRPRFNAEMRDGRRSQEMYDKVKCILDLVQESKDSLTVRGHLKTILTELRRYLDGKTFDYPIPFRVSLSATLHCIEEYLKKSSGGARLQAVAHGLFKSLSQHGMPYDTVRSRHVNASDTASRSAGDVECFKNGANILTVEVKDRPLTSDEVDSSVIKARLAGVTELLFFVYRANDGLIMAGNDKNEILLTIDRNFSTGLNLYVENAFDFLRLACTLLGEEGRKSLLVSIGEALGEQGADPQHRWAWTNIVREL
jgi:hypothetical protein